jgi:hypothetical protein
MVVCKTGAGSKHEGYRKLNKVKFFKDVYISRLEVKENSFICIDMYILS